VAAYLGHPRAVAAAAAAAWADVAACVGHPCAVAALAAAPWTAALHPRPSSHAQASDLV
jgi:hypothetical protein